MIEIWVILRRKHKIVHDALAPYNDMRPTEVALPESLNDICRAWDIPRPMILKRHRTILTPSAG